MGVFYIFSPCLKNSEALVNNDRECAARIEELKEKHEQDLKDQEEELTTHFAVVLAKVAVDSGNGKEEPMSPETEKSFSSFASILLKYSSCADQEAMRQGKVALEAASVLEPQSLQVAHAQAAFTYKVTPSLPFPLSQSFAFYCVITSLLPLFIILL